MYFAHITEDKTKFQTIEDHQHGTAKLAGDFAASFGCRDWGYGCGSVHDIGKYSDSFQNRLKGGPPVDHATAGARELYQCGNILQAYCVAGHHSGLPDGGSQADTAGMPTLCGRMKKRLKDYHAFKEEVELPLFSDAPLKPLGKGGFSAAFFVRMLFSCLVDADYLDTEQFMTGGKVDRGCFDSMQTLHTRLLKKIGLWLKNTDQATVNGRRTVILNACLEKGRGPQGLYQLTVPTGGGKTISSLAFAIEHACAHHLDRIIYVIPYTSIIEQNAQVFRDMLEAQNVLENHSNVVYDREQELDPMQLAAENWDKPVVVTTNVQFFESLFSNKPSRCRKLHNISNSVVIFDEAQMLPVNYLRPCVRAISELVYNFHCTAVLCTATQPSLQEIFPAELRMQEICPDVKGQYRFFKRTNVTNIGEISEDQLVSLLNQEKQALCILNSRKRVQNVYKRLSGQHVYHLSTFMYPKHRKRILEEIRTCLSEGKECRVVSTSLVEAGVDFDFETVFRELAGIDSIIQAAGRCNREGKRDLNKCKTHVFTLEKQEGMSIPETLRLPIKVAEQVADIHEDITSPEAIHEYFSRLYHHKGEGLDGKNIVGDFEDSVPSFHFPFASVARKFRLIESRTVTILIDAEPEAQAIAERLRYGEYSRSIIREAGQYCINIYEKDFELLYGAGRLKELVKDIYLLRNREQYTKEIGLVMDVSRGDALFL
ncbi:CRISPR-associated helicase/endonuclease Cas3 [Blautia schinkii]|nr:CRISPR-associated helicase/endonuclease Cas3 [Blautia schinkii]